MDGITYILNTAGKPVGMYTKDQCIPIEEVEVNPGAKKQEPVAANPKLETSLWQRFLNINSVGVKTGGVLAGCGGTSAVLPNLNGDGGGIPLVPPTPDIPDAGATTLPSGAIIIGPLSREGTVILPVDPNGNIVLPDDIWFEINGEGTFFQETPWIALQLPETITAPGLHNLDLSLVFGTDSTPILGMPPDGCYSDLINKSQFSDEDIAAGAVGCLEPGYEKFVACPSDEANRLKLYLAGYRINSYRRVGGQSIDAGEVGNDYVSTPEQLYTDPASAQRVGVTCGNSPNPNCANIPNTFYNNDSLTISFRLRKIVDARAADSSATYGTYLRVSLKSGACPMADGGTPAIADGGTD